MEYIKKKNHPQTTPTDSLYNPYQKLYIWDVLLLRAAASLSGSLSSSTEQAHCIIKSLTVNLNFHAGNHHVVTVDTVVVFHRRGVENTGMGVSGCTQLQVTAHLTGRYICGY